MPDLQPYSDRELPMIVGSGISSFSTAKQISAALLNSIAAAAAAALLPIIRTANASYNHQLSLAWVVDRFEYYARFFYKHRKLDAYRKAHAFCRQVSAVRDETARFRFMHVIVTACETDFERTVTWLNDLNEQLLEEGFKRMRQFFNERRD